MSPDHTGIAMRRRAMRLALAVTIGLAFETVRGGILPFLAPVIALQLLAVSPMPPPGKMLVMLLAAAAGSAGLSYIVAVVAIGIPGLYGIGVGLLYLWAFGLTFTPGLRPIGTMMVTMTVVITAMVAVSSDLALGLLAELILSVIEGVILIVLAHTIFPHPVGLGPQRPLTTSTKVSALSMPTRAVLATVVMLPLHLYLTSDGVAAIVILLTTATMLQQPGIAESTRYSLMYAAGNGLGGLIAGVSAFTMRLHDEFIVLVSITAATSLLLSTLMVKSDRLAPILLPGFVAYTVLFGLTLSSLPLVYEIDVIKRMVQIFFAATYALGAVSLLVPIVGWLKAAFRMRRAF